MSADTNGLRGFLHSALSGIIEFMQLATDLGPDFVPVTYLGDDRPEPLKRREIRDHHNRLVLSVMETFVPFQWGINDPPPAYQVVREELAAILSRWGLGDALDEGIGPSEEATFRDEDPSYTLTPDELSRLSRAIKGMEWYIFALSSRGEGDEDDHKANAARDLAGATNAAPLFFPSRRKVGEAVSGRLREAGADRSATNDSGSGSLGDSFGLGKTGQFPDAPRLVEILGRSKEFLCAVETCLPISDDEERGTLPFAVHWVEAEFFVCRAASELCSVMDGDEGRGSPTDAASSHGWNTEVSFGLRCLASQLDALLERWDASHWEERLARGGPTAERPATISAEELAGLRRTVETIESGMAHFGFTKSGEPELPSAAIKRRKGEVSKRLKIIEVYHDHRDWSYTQIAAEAGADRGHVCRIIKPIRDRERGKWSSNMPRGSKGKDGELEAWMG